jgi:uncharacterized protein with HEPN domain
MPLDERDETRLRDMLIFARDAVSILDDMTQQQMQADAKTRHALVRCLEVIGEAAHQVSPPVRNALPTVPWPMMWGMRNRLIHDYGNTDYGIVYRVVAQDLPGLIEDLRVFLTEHGQRLEGR